MLGYGTGASVSYQLKRLRSEMGDDKKKRKQIERIEKEVKESNI